MNKRIEIEAFPAADQHKPEAARRGVFLASLAAEEARLVSGKAAEYFIRGRWDRFVGYVYEVLHRQLTGWRRVRRDGRTVPFDAGANLPDVLDPEEAIELFYHIPVHGDVFIQDFAVWPGKAAPAAAAPTGPNRRGLIVGAGERSADRRKGS